MNWGNALLSNSQYYIPAGWLPCDGSVYSAATYDLLFSSIRYLYGGSGGAFNVPDLRGRVTAGADDMNTSAGSAGRLNGWQPGQSGGEATHVLTQQEIPTTSGILSSTPGVAVGNSTPAVGHNNIQPTMCVSKLIRY